MKLVIILTTFFLGSVAIAQDNLLYFPINETNSCEISDSSGTIDVMNCPGDSVWRCYDQYSCEDGSTYTIYKGCAKGVQDCW